MFAIGMAIYSFLLTVVVVFIGRRLSVAEKRVWSMHKYLQHEIEKKKLTIGSHWHD